VVEVGCMVMFFRSLPSHFSVLASADLIRHAARTVGGILRMGYPDCAQSVYELGILDRLVALLHHHSRRVVTPVLELVEKELVHRQDHEVRTQLWLDAGVARALNGLLRHSDEDVIEKALSCVEKLMDNSQEELQACIDGGIVDTLKEALLNGSPEQLAEEAVNLLADAFDQGSLKQVTLMVTKRAVSGLFVAAYRPGGQRFQRECRRIIEDFSEFDLPSIEEVVVAGVSPMWELLPTLERRLRVCFQDSALCCQRHFCRAVS
jgi:hypothetical protein